MCLPIQTDCCASVELMLTCLQTALNSVGGVFFVVVFFFAPGILHDRHAAAFYPGFDQISPKGSFVNLANVRRAKSVSDLCDSSRFRVLFNFP